MAALGVLSSQSAPAAVVAMGLVGALAGYGFAYSLRLAIFGLVVALTLLVSQGLFLEAEETLPALLWGTVGGLTQVLWSLIVWVVVERCARTSPAAGTPAPSSRPSSPTSPCARKTSATRSASAPRWRSGSRSTAPSTWTTTASGSR